MKKILFIILFIPAFYAVVNAQQDTSFRLIKLIPGDFVDFTVDNLDNIYVLNNRNQVKKLNASGDSVAVYNDIRKYGQASLMDASNPLRLLLYYRDFATVVVLDRMLNIRNSIEFRKKNILQVKAIGQSYDNRIWLFDELENKLKKIDEEGNLLLETPDFRQMLGQSPSPLKIFDENKYVYLYDSLQGVYVFDYYGALKTSILINHWQNFKVTGKYIFGSRADTLYRYEINSFSYETWKMPRELSLSRAFNFTSSRLYALKKEGIEIYTIH